MSLKELEKEREKNRYSKSMRYNEQGERQRKVERREGVGGET